MSPIGVDRFVAIWAVEGGLLFAILAVVELSFRRIKPLFHTALLGLYSPADQASVRRSLIRADQLGHVQFEADMIRQNGSNFPVQMDVVSVRGEDGELLYRVATAQDISTRKQAEEEIAYQASILEQVNDAVIATDERFFIKSWNAAAERMYGWKSEEIIGLTAEKVLQTEFSGSRREDAVQRLQESGEFAEEVTQVRKDGTRIDLDAQNGDARI